MELTLLVCLVSRQPGLTPGQLLKRPRWPAAKASVLGQGSPLLHDEQAPPVGEEVKLKPLGFAASAG